MLAGRCRESSGPLRWILELGPQATAVTTAEATGRKGALQALERCKPNLKRVRSLLCDGSYTGAPFAEGVRNILGEPVTVQIAKRSELHTFKVMLKRWVVERASLDWRKTGDSGKTASASSTPACSSSIDEYFKKDCKQNPKFLHAPR